MQQVARNRECLKELNNIPCVIFVHQDARYARNREYLKELNNIPCVIFVHQDARYARNRECLKGLNNVPCVVWSCNKLHATHEIVNYALRLVIRAAISLTSD